MLAPSTKPLAEFCDEDRMRSFLNDALQDYMERGLEQHTRDLVQRSLGRPLGDLARTTPPAASTALTYRQSQQTQAALEKTPRIDQQNADGPEGCLTWGAVQPSR
jgi:hypothetical protein